MCQSRTLERPRHVSRGDDTERVTSRFRTPGFETESETETETETEIETETETETGSRLGLVDRPTTDAASGVDDRNRR